MIFLKKYYVTSFHEGKIMQFPFDTKFERDEHMRVCDIIKYVNVFDVEIKMTNEGLILSDHISHFPFDDMMEGYHA